MEWMWFWPLFRNFFHIFWILRLRNVFCYRCWNIVLIYRFWDIMDGSYSGMFSGDFNFPNLENFEFLNFMIF